MRPTRSYNTRHTRALAAFVALLVALPLVQAYTTGKQPHFERRQLVKRASPSSPNGISDAGKAFDGQTFDYVVVGGGTAGLTVASRLSENSSITVAVIEAGVSGEGDTTLTTPNAMLYNSSEHTVKDWADNTINQTGLNNRAVYYPRGKVLGGSSAINGMYMVRQPALEQASWANLVANISDGAKETWGWDNMLAAMKKSETFTPPTKSVANTVNAGAGHKNVLGYKNDSHGASGQIHSSWPGVSYESIGAFLQGASQTLNLPINQDPDNGNNTGPFLSTSAINPTNWTRSFSRSGYLDPFIYRPNLFVLTGNQATKIVFDNSSTPRAIAVRFAASQNATSYTVNANKEVILSAGVIGSPQLLQLSGVGDSSVLDPVGIKQVANVPGVGFHMQDHLSGALSYTPAPGSSQPVTSMTGDAKNDSFANAAVAYVPIGTVVNKSQLISNLSSSLDHFVSAYDAPSTVQAGYRAALTELIDNMYPKDAPAIEILWFLAYDSISIQCGLQHPTSQGSVKITSADAFDLPAIDPAYLTNDIDLDVLRSGCKLARQISQADVVKPFVTTETSPGSSVQSDAQFNSWIEQSFATEYHPSSSCAMLPLAEGGVVDDRLRVYNTKGLRVVDASVPPITFSQHLLTVTYGIAEIAAELIALDNGAQASSSGSLTGPASTSAPAAAGPSSPSTAHSSKSGAGSLFDGNVGITLAVLLVAVASQLL